MHLDYKGELLLAKGLKYYIKLTPPLFSDIVLFGDIIEMEISALT